MLTLTPESEQYLLDTVLDSVDTWFHLYTNNPNPEDVHGVDDLVQLDTPDYAPVRVNTWAPAVIRHARAVSEADPVRWDRGPGGVPRDVYGYYVTDGETGPLLWWSEPSAEPVPMHDEGQSVMVWPRLSLRPIPPEEE